jgi:starch phosphorylase
VTRFYRPAAELGRRVVAEGHARARELARWKEHVYARWPGVKMRQVEELPRRLAYGEGMHLAVDVALNGLKADDMVVEALLANDSHAAAANHAKSLTLSPTGHPDASGMQRYELNFVPERCGRFEYRIRAYPRHPLLAHRLELGLMLWV